MPDIIKLSLVMALIVLLLRKKVKIGHVMLISSGVLAALYLMHPSLIMDTISGAITNAITLKLILALFLIRMLELVLREHEILKEMMQTARNALKSPRAVMVSMPLLIGMLPSVGGAYFSAPMVEESTRGMQMPPDEKSFVNYWFRHPWEYVLPLYPGILLASALSGIELRTLILANISYALVMGAGGFIFSMRQIEKASGKREVSGKGLMSFLPIAMVLGLVIFVRLELYISILLAVAGLLMFYRYKPKDILRVLKHGASIDVAVLILGVMLFKGVMESSGSVENLSLYFSQKGIPLMPTLFLLPFVAGALTGLTIGFVGATFPLIASLAGGDTVGAVSFAFASGFLGVMFSPVHVCLVLTREYFKAEMTGIYRRMLLPSMLIMTTAVAVYLFQ
jgi:integral membrane protein (TIGR00529 family)